MSHVKRKPVHAMCEKQRHRSACNPIRTFVVHIWQKTGFSHNMANTLPGSRLCSSGTSVVTAGTSFTLSWELDNSKWKASRIDTITLKNSNTVKILKIQTHKIFAANTLKFEQGGSTIECSSVFRENRCPPSPNPFNDGKLNYNLL